MVSIASIGYGDIYPTNNFSKVVLCLYIIAFLGNLPIFVRIAQKSCTLLGYYTN